MARAEQQEVTRQMLNESFRHGVWGYVDDALCLIQPWGFDVTEIGVPTRVLYVLTDVLDRGRDVRGPRRLGNARVDERGCESAWVRRGQHGGRSRVARARCRLRAHGGGDRLGAWTWAAQAEPERLAAQRRGDRALSQ